MHGSVIALMDMISYPCPNQQAHSECARPSYGCTKYHILLQAIARAIVPVISLITYYKAIQSFCVYRIRILLLLLFYFVESSFVNCFYLMGYLCYLIKVAQGLWCVWLTDVTCWRHDMDVIFISQASVRESNRCRWIPSQSTSDMVCSIVFFVAEQAVKKLPSCLHVIWDAMMLMWHCCNAVWEHLQLFVLSVIILEYLLHSPQELYSVSDMCTRFRLA